MAETTTEGFQLTITPIKPSAIPSEETLIAAGKKVLETMDGWKQGKTFYKYVKTSSRPKQVGDGAPWHARTSVHSAKDSDTAVTFDQLWEKLGVDKPVHEKEFIPEIKKVAKVKDISPTASIWTAYYTFPPPVSPRVFTVLQVVSLSDPETTPRIGIIVSIPIDLSGEEDKGLAALEAKGVKGRYVSVERILELDNGDTEWKMATSSTPGGSIPSFIVESTMAGKIAQDVPHFLKWRKSLPQDG